MNIDHEFENILDEALAAYGDAEALGGLEDRVLLRLQDRLQRRRNIAWLWCAAAATAAAVAIVIWVGSNPGRHHPAGAATIAQKPISAPQPVKLPQTMPGANDSRRSGRKPSSPASPALVSAKPNKRKPQQFPTPEPLTANEEALLTLAKVDPQAFQMSSNDLAIAIAPIEITPLDGDHASSEGEN